MNNNTLAPTYRAGELASHKILAVLTNRPTRRKNLENTAARHLQANDIPCSTRKNMSLLISFMHDKKWIEIKDGIVSITESGEKVLLDGKIAPKYKEWCNKKQRERRKQRKKNEEKSATTQKHEPDVPVVTEEMKTIQINGVAVSGSLSDLASILKEMKI
jgi:hypothetical protein